MSGKQTPLSFNFNFVPMTTDHVRTAVQWRYERPYHVYNLDPDELEAELAYALNPANGMVSLLDETGALLAFGSFGKDGQVPGGDYSPPALDIGLALRPDLTGRGIGIQFVRAMIAHANSHFGPGALRVTIAAFNERAQKVWRREGFIAAATFGRTGDEMPFILYMRPA